MNEMKTTLVRIPVDLHKKLKVHVATEGVTISSILTKLITKYMEEK